ncbi:diguanylate cyclase [Oscillatoria sp. FACHB-1407]|uniref:diguanylate cyclase domain-containing protein n=1 Tax=Oscillatoria sp. FACHB-1407 TaxID=2692847 RepID=UPI0016861C6D|nr:diguanylate cyclase [Oscillatoria sp. FACHB-1407]MBD2461007.1 diguanylate cyclase [Oscillatoria sp. FACHB-1407]
MARILVVEDERVVAWNIQEILQLFDHTVVANVASALEAIQIVGETQPDLVLMDIRLRGAMDGIEAAKAIWDQFKIPVVYLTAHADDQTLKQALVAAPFGYLLKPFNRLELQVTIETALRRHQVERELAIAQYWLKTTLSSIGDATITTDRMGRITFMNSTAEALTGWQIGEVLGQSATQILQFKNGVTDEAIANPLFAAMQTQTRVLLFDNCVLLRRDGSEHLVCASASPIVDEEGSTIGSVLVLQDASHRTEALESRRQEAGQERLMIEMTQQIRRSLDLNDTLNTAVAEIRRLFQTDRVLIYRFDDHYKGTVIAESVGEGWMSLAGQVIVDECVRLDRCIHAYIQGHIQNIPDIQRAALAPCYVELLVQLQVRANLVVPIVQGDQVWGLIAVQHCSAPRQWLRSQVDVLKQLSQHVAIAIQQSEQYQTLQTTNQELQRLAMMDSLTQVANRRYFDAYLQQEWHRLKRDQVAISLLLCDIDYFKNYNDYYGHQAGDICLQQIALAIAQTAKRPADFVARYGGEEFAIVLPNTAIEGAIYMAEQIQQAIAQLAIPHAASGISSYVTISLGICSTIPTLQQTPQRLIAAADQALYRAKTNGRNLYYVTAPSAMEDE